MKFNTIFVGIIVLVLVLFLFMYNDRSHRPIVQNDEITVHVSLSFEFWIILLLSLNLFIVIMIWFKLSRPSTREKEVISCANDPVLNESFQCFDLIHINRSTAKILINEINEKVKCVRKFGIAIKPHTLPNQKLRMCIEVMQFGRSLFLIIDYDHTADFHTFYASSLRQIFRSVLQSSNEVLTCGNLGEQLQSCSMFRLFSYDQIMKACSIDERNKHYDMISDLAKRFLTCSCSLCQDS